MRRGRTVVPHVDGISPFKWVVFLGNLALSFSCLEIKLISALYKKFLCHV